MSRLSEHDIKAALDQFLKFTGLGRFAASLQYRPGFDMRNDHFLTLSIPLDVGQGGIHELMDALKPIADDIKASEAVKPKRPEGFRTTSIGRMTPEVLMAQISELKWKGLIVVGIPEGQDPDRPEDIPFAYNSCGLSTMEFVFLTKHLEARAIQAMTTVQETSPGYFAKD